MGALTWKDEGATYQPCPTWSYVVQVTGLCLSASLAVDLFASRHRGWGRVGGGADVRH